MKDRGDIGRYLGVLLAERGMRQIDLAKKAGVGSAYISAIFLGQKNLGLRSIPKIVDAIEPTKRLQKPILYRLHFMAATESGFIVSEFQP